VGETRRDDGVLIASRLEDAPLFEDGLKAGDVVYAMNRAPVTNVAQWRAALARLKAGDPVALQIERQGKLLYLAFEMP
jgi:S1-C subfamily serine protease